MTHDVPRFTVSGLAQSFYFQCDQHVKLTGSADGVLRHGTKKKNANTQQHCNRGNAFEAELLVSLRSWSAIEIVDHSATPVSQTKQVLREAKVGQVLYQLPFELPEWFYEDKNYRLGRAIPDLLWIKQDPTTKARMIFVIDIKSSKSVSTSHQFQVGSYSYLLSLLVQDIRNLEMDPVGGVWLPSSDMEPETFRVDLMIPKIKHFYSHELPAIIRTDKPKWLYNAKCKSCSYTTYCRKEAAGTIPYMTEERLRRYHYQADNNDIEDLANQLSHLNLDTHDQTVACYLDAYKTKKPQFIGKPVLYLAKETDDDIVLSLITDPLSQKLCAYAIKVFDPRHKEPGRQYVGAVTPSARRPKDYIDLTMCLVRDLATVLTDMENLRSRCTIVTSDVSAKWRLQKCLFDLVAHADDWIEDAETRSTTTQQAMNCLLALFQDTQLLSLTPFSGHPEVMENNNRVTVARMVSIEQLLRDHVALGVPGYYTLKDMVQWMCDDDDANDIMDDQEIYGDWVTGSSSTQAVLLEQVDWLHSILDRFRQLAINYEAQTGQLVFCLESKPFTWPTLRVFKSPHLGRLSFFKQMEMLASCDSVRASRLADLLSQQSQGGGGLRLRFRRLQKVVSPVRQSVSWVASFSLADSDQEDARVKLSTLTKSTMKDYLLVPDTTEGILEAVAYPDLVYRGSMRNLGASAFSIYSVEEDGVSLQGYFKHLGLVPGKVYRLYQRYVDFNTDKVLETLQEMDAEREDIFQPLLEDPNAWAETPKDDDDLTAEEKATALKLRDSFSMSPSQKDISEKIIQRRLQIVWGPPGSGKTEFLALFINWFIQHLHKGQQRLLIGITAFTRHAIMNLLKRIAQVRSRSCSQKEFKLISLGSSGNNGDQEGMIHCTAQQLQRKVTEADIAAVVAGGTVWDWHKVRKQWNKWDGCDMMIIDEASQLLVSDAALAIRCLHQSKGRLVVAGDHMQLGPILQNEYPKLDASEPLLFGSIQQCLMRTRDNKAISSEEFILRKGSRHDFGPCTIQLKDNWRMNDELNGFFMQVYGNDLASHYPRLRLEYDADRLTDQRLKSILDPNKSIVVVRARSGSRRNEPETELEANVVEQIVRAHFHASKRNNHRVMVVTPHHRQRAAVQRRLLAQDFGGEQILVDTVEKMQGQECELVLACFTFADIADHRIDFLLDFKRWNVAISRARCKVIVVTTDHVMSLSTHGSMNLFKKRKTTEGWGFICLLEAWALSTGSVVEWIDE